METRGVTKVYPGGATAVDAVYMVVLGLTALFTWLGVRSFTKRLIA